MIPGITENSTSREGKRQGTVEKMLPLPLGEGRGEGGASMDVRSGEESSDSISAFLVVGFESDRT